MASQSKHAGDVLSYQFNYDGHSRLVDNVTLENGYKSILGYEIRKSGKFSFRIKRFSLSKISNLCLIQPVSRQRPNLVSPKKASDG